MATRNTTTVTDTVSIEQFAYGVGALTTQLRENSLSFNIAYVKGTPEQQRDLRVRWTCNHLRGALNVTLTQAEAVRDAGKGGIASNAHKLAIDRAYSDFRYYVVRPAAKAAERGEVTIPAAVLAHLRAIDELVATYPEMRTMCSAYITEASK